ncbi:heptaprenylglyceryl phosphate synthase [Effusibacillus consociatus]|uniref:Heptaprenylglyceryl phosphate synthase n=1 Tax=Effusibacillus consociatus TaxID=1117041 RepID=A0ABV9QBK1_9BACL
MSAGKLPWTSWRHVVKLDPDRAIANHQLEELGRIATDAVLIGGTQGITFEKTADLMRRLRIFAPSLPVWQEISDQSAVMPDADGYGIPVALNAGNTDWLIGKHVEAVEQFGRIIPWERVVTEGYIILNPDAAVAKLTQSAVPQSSEKAVAYATAAEQIFGIRVIYLEYSGKYGDPDWVRAVRQNTNVHLVYGGGIDSAEKAVEMADIADTIVVGNALYEKGMDVVRETVRAVHSLRK